MVSQHNELSGRIRIGISGWRYAPWRNVFYPPGLAQRKELEFAASRLNSIEINGSFYSLQRPELYTAWRNETPADFVFSVKGGRFITHMKKLREVEAPLANFFASGVLCLEHKLGPFLWQFPESFPFSAERFEQFFELLPRDTRAAARLAEQHDARMVGRSVTHAKMQMKLRHAVEVRSKTFLCSEFIELLRKYGIALVVADTAGRWPYFEDLSSDFVYVRLHGDTELYSSGYSPTALARWAERIRLWSRGGEPQDAVTVTPDRAPSVARDVYVYFDNDAKVHAPFDAIALSHLLLSPELAAPKTPQARATTAPERRATKTPEARASEAPKRSAEALEAQKRRTRSKLVRSGSR
jgi:uncharacterized protein YecE (DUF72 family)